MRHDKKYEACAFQDSHHRRDAGYSRCCRKSERVPARDLCPPTFGNPVLLLRAHGKRTDSTQFIGPARVSKEQSVSVYGPTYWLLPGVRCRTTSFR